MTAVREKMTKDPVVCESTDTVSDAAKQMRENDIGNVLVKLDGSYGIVTDRDIVVRAIAKDLAPNEVTLGDVATRDLDTVSADDDLEEVVERMARDDVRRVPVLEDGTPVGILSLGDLAVMRDPDSVLADISAAPGNN